MFPQATPPRRANRCFQFSVRSLLLLTFLVAIALTIWNAYIAEYVRERRAAAHIEKLGGTVSTEPHGPQWLRRIIGDKHMQVATAISLRPAEFTTGGSHSWTTRPLSAQNIAWIAGSKHLRSLDLAHCDVDDEAAAQLGSLQALEKLDLAYTSITDIGVRQLSSLTNLRWLRLHGTQITDAALDELASLPRLELLVVHETQVTSAGVSQIIKQDHGPKVACLQVQLDRFIPTDELTRQERECVKQFPYPIAQFSIENFGSTFVSSVGAGQMWQCLFCKRADGSLFLRELQYSGSDFEISFPPGTSSSHNYMMYKLWGVPVRWGPGLDDYAVTAHFLPEPYVFSEEFRMPSDYGPQDNSVVAEVPN